MQTIEGTVLEKLLRAQSLLDNVEDTLEELRLNKDMRPKAELIITNVSNSSNILDEVLDMLQPGTQPEVKEESLEPKVEPTTCCKSDDSLACGCRG